jgi:hypothetical protein
MACGNNFWAEFELEYENVRPVLTIEKSLPFETETKDDVISSFISNPSYVSQPVYQLIEISVNNDILDNLELNIEEEE